MAEDDHRWSNLGFAEEAAVFKGPTQNVRALSEGWVAAHMFCPACGAERLRALPNNAPVGDFVCDACAEAFELKAKGGKLGPKILDGASAEIGDFGPSRIADFRVNRLRDDEAAVGAE